MLYSYSSTVAEKSLSEKTGATDWAVSAADDSDELIGSCDIIVHPERRSAARAVIIANCFFMRIL